MATYIFGVRVDTFSPPQPLLSTRNLLQFDGDDYRRNGRSPTPFLDDSSRFNQETVHAGDQEPQERRSRRPPVELSLKLACGWGNFEWDIKKTLTKSDVNNLCRLMLTTTEVQERVLSQWDEGQRRAVVDTKEGVRVDVWDIQTNTMHQLRFKKWKSSKSFVFTNNWSTQFVKRRALKEGDKIGLYWDSDHSRFWFYLLSSAQEC